MTLVTAKVETSTEKEHVIMCEGFNAFMQTAFFCSPNGNFFRSDGERFMIEDCGRHPSAKPLLSETNR